jgi:hypothetical protein
MMGGIFEIDDLVGYVLDFIPRRVIGTCMLVNKRFYKMIKVDDDYESVAKNEDFFSLGKIKYSPVAVMEIAMKYKNVDMMRYLIHDYKKLTTQTELGIVLGFIGDKTLTKQFSEYDYRNETYTLGLFKGEHIHLIADSMKSKFSSGYTGEIFVNVYKENNTHMKILLNTIIQRMNDIYHCNYKYIESKLIGKCARKDLNFDKLAQLQKKYSDYSYANICLGLIIGNHYDMFMWAVANHTDYSCRNYPCFKYLIQHNNFKFFTSVFLDYFGNFKFRNNKKRTLLNHNMWRFEDVAKICIDYKRTDMLILLLDYVKFDSDTYQKILQYAIDLEFDNMVKIISEKIDI